MLPNVQLTIEKLDRNGNLTFLDLNVNVDSRKKSHVGATKNLLIPASEATASEATASEPRNVKCTRYCNLLIVF